MRSVSPARRDRSRRGCGFVSVSDRLSLRPVRPISDWTRSDAVAVRTVKRTNCYSNISFMACQPHGRILVSRPEQALSGPSRPTVPTDGRTTDRFVSSQPSALLSSRVFYETTVTVPATTGAGPRRPAATLQPSRRASDDRVPRHHRQIESVSTVRNGRFSGRDPGAVRPVTAVPDRRTRSVPSDSSGPGPTTSTVTVDRSLQSSRPRRSNARVSGSSAG
ncbi:hypothetical protein HTG_10170 [Natrinema mahii]|nr:hypothetical protein HTG_10170 [Natrinema mahii]